MNPPGKHQQRRAAWRYRAARLVAIITCRKRGPAARHPESVTAELPEADEELLAELDAVLWPRQARAVRSPFPRPGTGRERRAS